MKTTFYLPSKGELCKKIGAISVTIGEVVLQKDIESLGMTVRVLRVTVNPDIMGKWRLNPNPPTSWLLAIAGKVYAVVQENANVEDGNSSTGPTTAAALLIGYQALLRADLAEKNPDALEAAIVDASPHEVPIEGEEVEAGFKEEVEEQEEDPAEEPPPAPAPKKGGRKNKVVEPPVQDEAEMETTESLLEESGEVEQEIGEEGEPAGEDVFSKEAGSVEGQEISADADDLVFESENEGEAEPPPPPAKGGKKGKPGPKGKGRK